MNAAASPVFTAKVVERAFKLGWSMSYNGKGGHRGAVRASDVRFMWETLSPPPAGRDNTDGPL